MLRKLIITSAALAALSTATATGALAMHGGRWGGGHPAGGWGHVHHNSAFRHHAFFFRHHRRFAFIGAPFAFGDECVVVRRVWTPWGWHWRRIWVCD
jgi:hypothetical protein